MLKKISILTLIVLSLNSCGVGLIVRGATKKNLSVEKNTVPPTYIRKDQTLIVGLWGVESYDKYVKKAFNKFYKGKKEFVYLGKLRTNEKYEDKDTYPFVFSQGPENIKLYKDENFSFTFTGGRPFHIFDRNTEKFYMLPFHSGYFGRVIQGYAMKLNAFIK
jgi:hypothetical protein